MLQHGAFGNCGAEDDTCAPMLSSGAIEAFDIVMVKREAVLSTKPDVTHNNKRTQTGAQAQQKQATQKAVHPTKINTRTRSKRAQKQTKTV